ncbi:tetratricopeptide repeat protein [Nodularia spumigena CS-586/05]|uniref:CHAT domain-containing protein n=1 Tax=Nodularia spumigena TaxID=70799 RepID=UPI00232B0641|nr:tetratricopeptide repeat protein [Nodularia spumigena]MDB9345143.1 tetratricopeptide repeat protein [Nodularia spumigena CS-588/06]MDB9371560.1 tetratricopeptide repeat protein [Nodularia spumigena CS-586/05]
MLTQLLQSLNKFFNRPVDHQQSRSIKAARGLEVEQPLPELTNADLEVLFTQLLEGVQQGRGQQWALQYLQRMDDRISVDRWIDWLLIFAEKLLLSPAPNYQLAEQMMQLGELGIGKVGELSYDIGIRLLTGEFGEPETESDTTTSKMLDHPLDSPTQELIPNFSESLWESENPEFETTAAIPAIDYPSEILTENTEELIWEYAVEAEENTAPSLVTPPEQDVMDNLSELLGESEAQKTAVPKSEPETAIGASLGRWDESANLVPQLGANLSTLNPLPVITADQPDVQAQDWFYQGLQQAKTGDLLGAIASYNQAIEINPDSAEYWFNHGLTLFHSEYFADAIASYDQAIALKPHHYKSWYNRGATLGELGQFEEAIACFDQAIAIGPQNPEAFSSKGLALFKLGQIPAAIASYDQALHLEPQDPGNWYYRGLALAVEQQYAEAIASYEKAIEIQPDFHEVWIDRGVVLFSLGNWSEAIASWDQALATQPDLYLAWYNRGIALENLGQREQAIASYHNAIAIKPDFHLAWYNQAVALFYLERFADAIFSYDNALQIKLDYWEAWIGRGTAASHLVTPTTLNSLTSITRQNPALQQGGYEGKLASLEQGLKHIHPDTHPEGWGRLHLTKGNTYYDLGKKSPTPRNYWCQAIAEYNQALLTLTTADFTELHLEVLQSLIKTHLGIGQTAQAEELQQRAADLLAQLLTESTRSDDSKKQLALKFAGIGQLEVDLAVEYGDLVEAWEMAEQGKNSCLTWLLSDWQEQIYSHYYSSVQQLLNPHTAIIYWHISPVALHTFIIKDQAPSPILLFTPIQDVGTIDLEENPQPADELPLPEAVRRLIEFENWLENWHQEYQEYLSEPQDQHSKSNHIWRVDMAEKLLQLQNILQISTIAQELEDITQLTLIPHRDLHRLPLHTLFNISSPSHKELPNNFTISYLPSVQKGLSVKTENIWQLQHQMLLSIEYPNSTNDSPGKLAQLESEIISQMFHNPQRIQGANATKNQVVNSLFDHKNILHFAGRVIHNFIEPKKSTLLLVDEEQITLEEICQTNLNSYKLITLAAGETARTKNPNITTEYVDLASGFICEGIPHVVSTLWTVESSTSALVMIEFYRRLQLNKSPVTALAEATLWLKELTALDLTKWYEDLLNHLDTDELTIKAYLATYLYRSRKMVPDKKLYNHPYYWAAYTIKGIIPE